MKILFFGTKSYDKQFFNDTWKDKVYEQIEIDYVDVLLTPDTARLAQGYEAVCAFVNMDLSTPAIETLAQCGVKLILMRCAGFNNVDLKTAEKIITPFYALSKSRDNEVLFSIVNGILAILALEYDENYQEYLKVLDENGAKEDYYYNKLKMIIVKLLISKGSKEEAKQHIDDLENNITKENLSKYVDTLLMLSEILIDDKNYEKATDYTDKALQVAIELDNIVFIENSYYLKGKIAKYQGSFIQWEMYMNLAIDLLLKFGSYSQKNDRYLEMANMYHVIGETREALKYLTMAAESEKELY